MPVRTGGLFVQIVIVNFKFTKGYFMAEKTGISWCDHTLNWWWICTEVTDECDNCYARQWAKRIKGYDWGEGIPRQKTLSAPRDLRKWDRKARDANVMRKVFAHSMSDIFDLEVKDEWRFEEFLAWRNTTNLWYLVLTKRPAVPKRYDYPSEKVWLGTSIGQKKNLIMAKRIVEAPAKLHWVSYEPAIDTLPIHRLPKEIKWVVIGGESGSRARPFNLEWAFETVQACKELGIYCFVKQLGAKPMWKGNSFIISDSHGKNMYEWPEELRIQEFPI